MGGSAWQRFKAWLHDLLWPAPPMPALTGHDLRALAETTEWAPPGGWYAWEAKWYRETGAPWFDWHRYDGTPARLPDPTIEDHQANYANSYAEAIQIHGRDLVEQATWWVNTQTASNPEMRRDHMRAIDPIGWCVEAYQRAGSPYMPNVPGNWSGGAPARRAAAIHEANPYANGLAQEWGMQSSLMAKIKAY
jgi:hypothetical protein